MIEISHLDAIRDRLARETARLASAKTAKEIAFRKVQISQTEKEIKGELKFLGLDDAPQCDMSDDELLAALAA